MFGFGAKKKAPDELVKEWRKELRKEQRALDRSLRSMETEERKARAEIKKLAKLGQTQNVRVVAQQLVRTKAAKEKIQFGKAQLGSVMMQMNNQLAMMKVSGCMQKSGEVLAAMTSAVKLPAITEAMRNMAREMERAGMIEEMVDDVFDIVDTVEEDAVDGEVDKVLQELGLEVAGALDSVGPTPTAAPVSAAQPAAAVAAAPAPAAVAATADPDLSAMQARLEAL